MKQLGIKYKKFSEFGTFQETYISFYRAFHLVFQIVYHFHNPKFWNQLNGWD